MVLTGMGDPVLERVVVDGRDVPRGSLERGERHGPVMMTMTIRPMCPRRGEWWGARAWAQEKNLEQKDDRNLVRRMEHVGNRSLVGRPPVV